MADAFLLVLGLGTALFVGFNIGGSSTGVAFGPSVGSKVLGKIGAAVLMSGFALLGGWIVGRNVIETMGGEIVPSTTFTLAASVAVLFFVGFALLISNLFGVPASTSMTAVGSIAGLGIATGTINWSVMGEIVSWWFIAPFLAFWICTFIGRYIYPYLDVWLDLRQSTGKLFVFDSRGKIPLPKAGPNVSGKEMVGSVVVVVIGCYMAFSAGASNVANAVAPLVGNKTLSMNGGILLAAAAISLGSFTIARRTLDTVGNDLTDLPLLAALIVEVVSATIITGLSWGGIPASLAVTATSCIMGLGWGRATRTSTILEAAQAAIEGEEPQRASISALNTNPRKVPPIGEENAATLSRRDLFNPSATARVVVMWVLTPTISGVGSFLLFNFVYTVV